MAKEKESLKKELRNELDPLLNHFKDALTANVPTGLAGKNEPITLTFIVNRKGTKTQGTIKFGRNKDGRCGWYKPKDFVGPCLE